MLGCLGVDVDVKLQLPCSGWLEGHVRTIWANVCSSEGREKYLPEALRRAAAELRQGNNVLVHCVWGRHRTGAFLGTLQVHDYIVQMISRITRWEGLRGMLSSRLQLGSLEARLCKYVYVDCYVVEFL